MAQVQKELIDARAAAEHVHQETSQQRGLLVAEARAAQARADAAEAELARSRAEAARLQQALRAAKIDTSDVEEELKRQINGLQTSLREAMEAGQAAAEQHHQVCNLVPIRLFYVQYAACVDCVESVISFSVVHVLQDNATAAHYMATRKCQ